MKVVYPWFTVSTTVKRVVDSAYIIVIPNFDFDVSSKKLFNSYIGSNSTLHLRYTFIYFFVRLQKRPFHSWSVSSHLGYKIPRSMSCCMSSAAVASQTSFSTQSLSINDPVVSVDWLHANLRDPNVKVCCLLWPA